MLNSADTNSWCILQNTLLRLVFKLSKVQEHVRRITSGTDVTYSQQIFNITWSHASGTTVLITVYLYIYEYIVLQLYD